jgi:hypothetical protein
MELDLPTPVSRPPSLGWRPRTSRRAQINKVVKVVVHHLRGYATWCVGAIQGKECGIQVLAGLAPSSQTVGSNRRIQELSMSASGLFLALSTSCHSQPIVVGHLSNVSPIDLLSQSTFFRSAFLLLTFYHRTDNSGTVQQYLWIIYIGKVCKRKHW